MLNLGIMGLSDGNGHPYSWSAIINGDFDRIKMASCGFSAIPNYLEANNDTLGIDSARVTHVWTQDRAISRHIAESCLIENIVNHAEDMIGRVNAVLLARDDPENHVAMAKPFLDANIPIFIDKPLAISTKDLTFFEEQAALGKLFMSCSSMRYSSECRSVKAELTSQDGLELATAVGKKDWNKYGVHMLEALLALLNDPMVESVQHVGQPGKDIVNIRLENGLPVTIHLFMDITPTFQISLFGRDHWKLIEIKNSYSMFRDNLLEFIHSVREGQSRLPFEKTKNIIRTLIGANESFKRQGEIIYLK